MDRVAGYYQPLSSEDRMFLACEGPETPMHIGATLVFEGDVDPARVLRYVESRLHLIPRYRQRLRYAALSNEPVWVDDDRFDARYHLRHVVVPPPGDDEAMKRLASHLISQPLLRSRPLWRLWVVTGLAGNRFAIVTTIHHCMADGIAGAALLAVLLAPHPDGATAQPAPFVPRPAPSPWRLLLERGAERLRGPLALARQARRLVTDARAVVGESLAYARGVADTVAAAVLHPAPPCALNRPIGRYRRFDWTDVPMDDVCTVRAHLGGSVNDVALATVAGALRRFALRRHPDEQPTDLRVLVPVSIRGDGERQALGNRTSAWLMTLPVREPDPVRRLEAVCRTTASLKSSRQHLGGQVLTSASNTLLTLGLRLVEQIHPFNLLVTNVPGPRETLYLLEAPLRRVYPEAPLFPRQGLGIALFGYADALCIGVHGDCHVVPDTERLVVSLQESFTELVAHALARAGAATRLPPRAISAERAGAGGRAAHSAA
ncbi:MAG TPA: wax ester/triacylglycerol synthase family O-acyltransferase [Candidatus Limnocylindria bacterium]|nr:wax ester/triacylglycerol synthase family O-acyltransferase [Candidatus Limnocylindria bacterium]